MTAHAGIRARIDDAGALIHEGYCSCGHVTEAQSGRSGKVTAGAHLVTHLEACPDEADAVDVSQETEAWAEARYPDQTCTLDEWRERYG